SVSVTIFLKINRYRYGNLNYRRPRNFRLTLLTPMPRQSQPDPKGKKTLRLEKALQEKET
ncbi:25011_t:CDS:2, partial [Gigaspora rosea]